MSAFLAIPTNDPKTRTAYIRVNEIQSFAARFNRDDYTVIRFRNGESVTAAIGIDEFLTSIDDLMNKAAR